MIFEYECLACHKVFTKESKKRCNNQKYCPECAKERIRAANKGAWKLRREREKRKIMER